MKSQGLPGHWVCWSERNKLWCHWSSFLLLGHRVCKDDPSNEKVWLWSWWKQLRFGLLWIEPCKSNVTLQTCDANIQGQRFLWIIVGRDFSSILVSIQILTTSPICYKRKGLIGTNGGFPRTVSSSYKETNKVVPDGSLQEWYTAEVTRPPCWLPEDPIKVSTLQSLLWSMAFMLLCEKDSISMAGLKMFGAVAATTVFVRGVRVMFGESYYGRGGGNKGSEEASGSLSCNGKCLGQGKKKKEWGQALCMMWGRGWETNQPVRDSQVSLRYMKGLGQPDIGVKDLLPTQWTVSGLRSLTTARQNIRFVIFFEYKSFDLL